MRGIENFELEQAECQGLFVEFSRNLSSDSDYEIASRLLGEFYRNKQEGGLVLPWVRDVWLDNYPKYMLIYSDVYIGGDEEDAVFVVALMLRRHWTPKNEIF